jgi:hypothetical protein
MRHRLVVTLSVALTALLVASGCATDGPVAPQNRLMPTEGASASKEQIVKVRPLERERGLDDDVQVTAKIGLLGGTLLLPAAGLTVVVPPGAVTQMTTFTIVAHKGNDIAYDFYPAGTQFVVPLVAMQDLSVTKAREGGTIDPFSLSVGYYPDPKWVNYISEILDADVSLPKQVSVFHIWHFSGYMFATGRDEF